MKALLLLLPAVALASLSACASNDDSATGEPTTLQGWNRYTNSELDFSFLYPPDLTYDEFSGPGVNGGPREDYIRFDSPQDRGRVLLFTLIANPDGLTLGDWVTHNTSCDPGTVRETTVADLPAIECTNTPEDLRENAVVFEREGVIFFITSVIAKAEFDTVIGSLEL